MAASPPMSMCSCSDNNVPSTDGSSPLTVLSDSLRRRKIRKRRRSEEPDLTSIQSSPEESSSKRHHPESPEPEESPTVVLPPVLPATEEDGCIESRSLSPIQDHHHSPVPDLILEVNSNLDDDDDFHCKNSSDSDSDDGLPSVSFNKEDEWSIAGVKPNTILWVKYGQYPHWPALVERVTKREKKINVYFFGWPDEHSIRMSYTKKKNFAPYTYKYIMQYKDCMEALREMKDSDNITEHFDQALKEADTLQQLRMNNEIEGTPRVQFKKISEMRPSKFSKVTQHRFNFDDKEHEAEDLSKDDDKDEDRDSDTNYALNDSEDDQPEDTSSPYCFSRLMEHFQNNQATLEKICLGTIQSELHSIYTDGTNSDRKKIRTNDEYGPAKSLTRSQKLKLYNYLDGVLVKTGHSSSFTYVYDVLLPEAMVRVISAIENCSLPEAWKILETC